MSTQTEWLAKCEGCGDVVTTTSKPCQCLICGSAKWLHLGGSLATDGHECSSIVAVEDAFARASVYRFAADEYLEAKSSVAELRRRRHLGLDRILGVDQKPFKPLADFSVFLAQSRDLRIRRERDATCYNDTTQHPDGLRRTDL